MVATSSGQSPSELSRGDLVALVTELLDIIAAQNVRIAELEARLNQNSRNSSKPPSSDGYAKPKSTDRSLRKSSGKKPGGQAGSAGHHLKCVEDPDEVITHTPLRCSDCGESLEGAALVRLAARQVFDIPPSRLQVSEHQAQSRRCACGAVTAARFPHSVDAPAQYGPRVKAAAIYLTAYQHIPYMRAAELLSDCLGAPLSTGTLHSFAARGGEGLEGFTNAARDQLAASDVCHFDETGARAAGELHWVHSASTAGLTHYALDEKRGGAAMDRIGILEKLSGVAVHDGWTPYRRYEGAVHALCNAHHLRELRAVSEQHPEDQSWAQAMSDLLLEIKASADSAKLAGATSLEDVVFAGFTERYRAIIKDGHNQNPPPAPTGKRGRPKRTKSGNLLHRLDQHQDDVLRFAGDLAVPFDNNLAERDIRMVKLQQKISGCWRTTSGAEAFLALRSYISTTRKQGFNTFDSLLRLTSGDPWIPAASVP